MEKFYQFGIGITFIIYFIKWPFKHVVKVMPTTIY